MILNIKTFSKIDPRFYMESSAHSQAKAEGNQDDRSIVQVPSKGCITLTPQFLQIFFRLKRLTEEFCNTEGAFVNHISVGSTNHSLDSHAIVLVNVLELVNEIKLTCQEPGLRLLMSKMLTPQQMEPLNFLKFLEHLQENLQQPHESSGLDEKRNIEQGMRKLLADQVHLMIGWLRIWDTRLRAFQETFKSHGLETLEEFVVRIEAGNYANNCYLVAAYNIIFKLKEIVTSSPDFHFSDATLQFYHHFCANSNFEYQMYPGKTIQAIGHYKNVELYQLGRSKEKANANAKVDVLEMQKTMDLSQLHGQFEALTFFDAS